MNRTEAVHVLASADRQLVLHELVTGDGTATVGELSREVAARRHRLAAEKVTSGMVDRAQVRLVHTHLPALAKNDVVEVDWTDRTVALREGENADRVFDAAAELDGWPPDDLRIPFGVGRR